MDGGGIFWDGKHHNRFGVGGTSNSLKSVERKDPNQTSVPLPSGSNLGANFMASL